MKQTITNDKVTPGHNLSAWFRATLVNLSYPALNQDLKTDVVVIGAGIAGITTAYFLLKAGLKVVVVEDGNVGSGETGHTTAHLSAALDDRYSHLEKIFGKNQTPLIASSHLQAIDTIDQIVLQNKIDCDLKRLSGYLFLHPSDKPESLQQEFEACRRAGLDVKMLDETPGMKVPQGACIEFANQGQFHPLKYLDGLCAVVTALGGRIYCSTRAVSFSGEGITTSAGNTVQATHIVVATNTPVNNKVTMHTKQFAYRSYVIGARVRKDTVGYKLWWDTGDHEADSTMTPYHYVRLQPLDNDYDLLICGGEDHPTGLPEVDEKGMQERYDRLADWLRHRFTLEDIPYRWSGQVIEPMDSLAYIGRNPHDKDNVYIVTGDSGHGMTHGTIAGLLITDLITGKENPWQKLYDPGRVKLMAGGIWFKEFVAGTLAYYKNKENTDPEGLKNLGRDEGKVVRLHGRNCGVYMDRAGLLHVVDATCTHLGCTVKWNKDEKTWDCPCHGSRFTVEGTVVNGPANEPLPYWRE
jgi:glycine/D-amino acid oxidase-like deaminating enzyme/nitrite reductase/ring-hydroxylating ferredoxin subunit